MDFYTISHKLRWCLTIIIKIFWCFSRTIFDSIRLYLTIFDDIWRRKRSHLKSETCLPKNIVKYHHLLSSRKRDLKQNVINLKKVENFLIILFKLVFSDKIINGYWIKVTAINAVTDLKGYLFYFKKGWKDNIWKQFDIPLTHLPLQKLP